MVATLDKAKERGLDFTYGENVELYRRQLWRGVLRQEDKYPHFQTRTKEAFNAKLMKYATRAGHNYLDAFGADVLKEKDLLIGWAGKKLKAKMRDKGRVHLGRKPKAVRRIVLKNVIHHMSLSNNLTKFRFVPAEPLEPWTIPDLNYIVDCRNGNKGCLQFIDSQMNTIRTIPYVQDKALDESAVLPLWLSISVPRSRPDSQGEVRPLFRRPGFGRQRRNETGVISESTVETLGTPSPTYITPSLDKQE